MDSLLGIEGLPILVFGAALAGLVRGFTGFGTAMVFLPFAAQVISPVWVLVTMMVMDLLGPLPAVRQAWREGHPGDVIRLGAAALVALPFGLFVLMSTEPAMFRYAVSGLTVLLLVLLVSGVRYTGRVDRPMIFFTGGVSGFLSGAVGLGGPPVIMLYMMRPLSPTVIRANTMLYLLLLNILTLSVFGVRGLLAITPLVLGAVLTPVYFGAFWIGSRVFDPGRETVYRWAAYVIIAGSAINGLPLWD